MLMYIGIVFSFVLGVVLYYSFNWSGRSLWMFFLAPTNDSRFEQLKMLLTPYLLWTLVEYFHYGQFMHAFIPAKVISLYIGMVLLTLLYWMYDSFSRRPEPLGRFAILGLVLLVTFAAGEFLMTLTFLDFAALEIVFDGVLVLTILLAAAFSVYAPNKSFFKSQADFSRRQRNN